MGSPEVLTAPVVMTIAGSDSGGGAGIQADIKTLGSLGVHGVTAITALTAQNTTGVTMVHQVSAEFLLEQLRQLTSDFKIEATKTGMLAGPELIEVVVRAVEAFGLRNLVVDPVVTAKSGARLIDEPGLKLMVSELFPKALIVTPNTEEAALILGGKVETLSDVKNAAEALHKKGPRYVLVKGGHLQGPATDFLFDGSSFVEFHSERIETQNTHGTGCILSSAIAGYLARGEEVLEAVRKAKELVTQAIRFGLSIGNGTGPANPLAWREWS